MTVIRVFYIKSLTIDVVMIIKLVIEREGKC